MTTRAAPEISPAALATLLVADEKVQLVDVRSEGEFAGRRIGAAKLVPLAQLESRLDELDRDALVVCICESGGRSAAARESLRKLGFSRVASLTGGVARWAREGLAVVEDTNAPWALERQVRVAAGILVLAGVCLGALVHPAFYGLAGFVGAGLVFAGVTNWCGMGLLLAKAPWNRVRD